MSTAEAVALNLAGALALASSVRDRRRDRAAGITVPQRRALTWNANASFVAGLGLDPASVLGPPPAPSANSEVGHDHHGDPPARPTQAQAQADHGYHCPATPDCRRELAGARA